MENKKLDFSDIHDCKKCHEKIVGITVDALGITRCGYCNEIVNYKPLFNQIFEEYLKYESRKI